MSLDRPEFRRRVDFNRHAQQRAARPLRYGVVVIRELCERIAHGADELERGLQHVGFVPRLVVVEPAALVVGFELPQEPHRPAAKSGKRHGLCFPCGEVRGLSLAHGASHPAHRGTAAALHPGPGLKRSVV